MEQYRVKRIVTKTTIVFNYCTTSTSVQSYNRCTCPHFIASGVIARIPSMDSHVKFSQSTLFYNAFYCLCFTSAQQPMAGTKANQYRPFLSIGDSIPVTLSLDIRVTISLMVDCVKRSRQHSPISNPDFYYYVSGHPPRRFSRPYVSVLAYLPILRLVMNSSHRLLS